MELIRELANTIVNEAEGCGSCVLTLKGEYSYADIVNTLNSTGVDATVDIDGETKIITMTWKDSYTSTDVINAILRSVDCDNVFDIVYKIYTDGKFTDTSPVWKYLQLDTSKLTEENRNIVDEFMRETVGEYANFMWKYNLHAFVDPISRRFHVYKQ